LLEQLTALELLPSASKKHNILQAAYQPAIDQALSVAIWRLPNAHSFHTAIDFSGINYFSPDSLEENSVGFIFSKFVRRDSSDSLFIKAGIHLKLEKNGDLITKKNINSTLEHKKYKFFMKKFNEWNDTKLKKCSYLLPKKGEENKLSSSKSDYCELVQAAIDDIERNKLDKIVVSRVVYVQLNKNFDPIKAFIQLEKCYPSLFISLVSTPEGGTWIGASPEHLLAIKNDQLRVVALAGTQAIEKNIALKNIAWREKEIREQALVSHYIRYFLQKQACSWQEVGPKTVAAGKLAHLQTSFTFSVNQENKRYLINKIIEELHPTSAICGMPKDKALSFILNNENYDRSFYCGFLGPININKESHLFVNIRCMQLIQNEACLYAGTGITTDSIAEEEWVETILKIETLLPILL